MPRDYYMVLGVERGADLSQIKQAYRNAIKRYHPDRFGAGTDPDKFMAAREAYEVLSDRNRRRAYDDQHRRADLSVHNTDVHATIRRRRRAWDVLRETRSPLDDFFEGLVPGLYRQRSRRPSIPKDLYMEVVLTPDEALRGGVFPVAVPVMEPCSSCDQSGWQSNFYCPACLGYGAVRSRREFELAVPPDVQPNTSVEISLADLGLPGVRLLIDVQVKAYPLR